MDWYCCEKWKKFPRCVLFLRFVFYVNTILLFKIYFYRLKSRVFRVDNGACKDWRAIAWAKVLIYGVVGTQIALYSNGNEGI